MTDSIPAKGSGRSATLRTVVLGGGVAGLEALLALHDLAGDRVEVTLVAPDPDFVYKPLAVGEPFSAGHAEHRALEPIARELGAQFVLQGVVAVDPESHEVELGHGERLGYDVLVVCVGARQRPAFRRAVTFDATGDPLALTGILEDVEGGWSRSVAFVVPPGANWPLPLYELALMTQRQAWGMGLGDFACTIVTPEAAPLGIFGQPASHAVAELLRARGIDLVVSSYARAGDDGRLRLFPGDRPLEAERVVALPVPEGPDMPGLPSEGGGFIPVDEHGRVVGLNDIYAAGDATTFPIKQGGLATQQADAVAEHIAARAGAPVDPQPFQPVLRGMLLTGETSMYLRHDVRGGPGEGSASEDYLWWPPHKTSGRYLSGWLAGDTPLPDATPPTRALEVEVALPREWDADPMALHPYSPVRTVQPRPASHREAETHRISPAISRPREEALAEVPLETRHFEDLGGYVFEPMIERLSEAVQHAGELVGGRTVWEVNSTAVGGGVAQLLRTLPPYWRGAGIDVRWMAIRGSAEFFRVTKRLHNHLHGQPGDGGVLGIDELTTLDRAADYHARALTSLLAPGDVVVLNDPQTAAMSVPLERAGANVIWRCHVGIDHDNELSRHAWSCLRPRLAGVDRFVFSRYAFLPEWLGGAETAIVTPAIDPASTKNRPMSDGAARAILQHLGLAAGVSTAIPSYDCTDGSTATLAAHPTVLDSDGAPDWSQDRVVVSLARWDRIKDPIGILDGFLERVLAATDAHLLLAGPDATQVADDPEAAAVLADVRERWRRLPPPARARVHLACLPLTSPDENAAMVNAIQRQAAVVVKKSLQEGFGLGVTEAMWKARPVVASAVGGHLEQIEHLHSGLLVEDPADVGAFGDAVVELLREPSLAARLGQTARERVRALFLNDLHFVRWVEVFGSALERRASATRPEGPTAGEPEQASLDAGELYLADHDHLTGLWNRRRFEEELDRRVARSRRDGERLALLSIDVDRYHDVTDRHGAGAAEGLIQSISQVLAKRLRPNKTLARMGGDEFAAVLPGATPHLVRSLADGLCTVVREHSHAAGSNRVLATVSIGGAFLDAGTQTHHDALLAADTALYEAKAGGGDRAILHKSSQGA
jgi:trehalose synthase